MRKPPNWAPAANCARGGSGLGGLRDPQETRDLGGMQRLKILRNTHIWTLNFSYYCFGFWGNKCADFSRSWPEKQFSFFSFSCIRWLKHLPSLLHRALLQKMQFSCENAKIWTTENKLSLLVWVEREARGGLSLIIIQRWHEEESLCLTSPSATSQLLPELGISAINWHFHGGCFQGINFFRDDAKIGAGFCCWFLQFFSGFFLFGFESEMSLMSEMRPNPSALSRAFPPHWHNIFSPSDLFLLFSLSAPHASISACWHHHKLGSSHWNFMPTGKSAPVSHRKTLELAGMWRWVRKNHFLQLLFLHGKADTIKRPLFGEILFKKATAEIFLQESSLLHCVRLLHVVHPNPMTSTHSQTLRTNLSAHFCIEFHSQSLDLLTS